MKDISVVFIRLLSKLLLHYLTYNDFQEKTPYRTTQNLPIKQKRSLKIFPNETTFLLKEMNPFHTTLNFRLKRLIEQRIKKIISLNIAIVKPFRFIKLTIQDPFSTQRNWNLLPLLSHTSTAHNNQPSSPLQQGMEGIPNPPTSHCPSSKTEQNLRGKKTDKNSKWYFLFSQFAFQSTPLSFWILTMEKLKKKKEKSKKIKNSNTKSHLCWTLRALFFLSTTILC